MLLQSGCILLLGCYLDCSCFPCQKLAPRMWDAHLSFTAQCALRRLPRCARCALGFTLRMLTASFYSAIMQRVRGDASET